MDCPASNTWLFNDSYSGAGKLDCAEFRAIFLMDMVSFEKLLGMVAPQICKKDMQTRISVLPRDKLFITLRYLATLSADIVSSLLSADKALQCDVFLRKILHLSVPTTHGTLSLSVDNVGSCVAGLSERSRIHF